MDRWNDFMRHQGSGHFPKEPEEPMVSEGTLPETELEQLLQAATAQEGYLLADETVEVWEQSATIEPLPAALQERFLRTVREAQARRSAEPPGEGAITSPTTPAAAGPETGIAPHFSLFSGMREFAGVRPRHWEKWRINSEALRLWVRSSHR